MRKSAKKYENYERNWYLPYNSPMCKTSAVSIDAEVLFSVLGELVI
jgi:hypothetical protein